MIWNFYGIWSDTFEFIPWVFCLRSEIPGQKIHNGVLDSGICCEYRNDEDQIILHPRYIYFVMGCNMVWVKGWFLNIPQGSGDVCKGSMHWFYPIFWRSSRQWLPRMEVLIYVDLILHRDVTGCYTSRIGLCYCNHQFHIFCLKIKEFYFFHAGDVVDGKP